VVASVAVAIFRAGIVAATVAAIAGCAVVATLDADSTRHDTVAEPVTVPATGCGQVQLPEAAKAKRKAMHEPYSLPPR
jgi:hypothetical protein